MMKSFSLIFAAALLLMLPGCKKKTMNENPFFSEYQTPFQVPPFDKIDTTDYIPAFTEAITRENQDIDKIVSNSENPSFENTILAFDRAGVLMTKVSKVFYNLNSANTNDQMQAI